MQQVTIYDATSTTLAAATATEVFARTNVGEHYKKLEVVFVNSGANPVTAAEWRVGTNGAYARDSTREADLIAKLPAGGRYQVALSDPDLPDDLTIRLTSAAGTTIVVNATGTLKG